MDQLHYISGTNLNEYINTTESLFLQKKGFYKKFPLLSFDFEKLFFEVKTVETYKVLKNFYEYECYFLIGDVKKNKLIGLDDENKLGDSICLSVTNGYIYYFEYRKSMDVFSLGIQQIENRYLMSFGFEDLFNKLNYASVLYESSKEMSFEDMEFYVREKMAEKFKHDVNNKKIFWYHMPEFIF
jgi:hypothetical protein